MRMGPYEQLRFEGELLIGEPGGAVIAKHTDHQWHVTSGGEYTRLECNARAKVHFLSSKYLQSRALGPFEHFSSIDGVAYTDRIVFAVCDRQLHDWYSHELGTHWKTMVVEPA